MAKKDQTIIFFRRYEYDVIQNLLWTIHGRRLVTLQGGKIKHHIEANLDNHHDEDADDGAHNVHVALAKTKANRVNHKKDTNVEAELKTMRKEIKASRHKEEIDKALEALKSSQKRRKPKNKEKEPEAEVDVLRRKKKVKVKVRMEESVDVSVVISFSRP